MYKTLEGACGEVKNKLNSQNCCEHQMTVGTQQHTNVQIMVLFCFVSEGNYGSEMKKFVLE
jgi:hypothetical protein